MRACLAFVVVLALGSATLAQQSGRTTAIVASPIHEAQVVRGDDGMDHVNYEFLVTNAFVSPVTLSSVAVLGPAGEELMRIEGDTLAAVTETLFAQAVTKSIPASSTVSVDVDLIVAPGAAPERVTHRIVYALEPDTEFASAIGSLEINGPEVAVNRQPAMSLKPPLRGTGWWVAAGCCRPNIHRDTRLAIDGQRIETSETFAIDWARIQNGNAFAGDGKRVDQHYAFGADVLAVGDGTIVSVRDDMPEETPFQAPTAVHVLEDYAGNHVLLEIAPNVYAAYGHLQPGSLTVKVGDVVKAGAVLGKLGNSGNSTAPHLHFGLLDQPDFAAGRSLPFVFDSFTVVAVDVSVEGYSVRIVPASPRAVESAYPLYPGIHDYP
jgi:hypothetical protein